MGNMVFNPPPNVTDFTTFLRTVAGIPATFLPDDSPWIPDALQVAQDTINPDLMTAIPNEATWAVYNLGTDRIINWAPDQTLALTSLTWLNDVVTVVTAAALAPNLVVGEEFQTILAGQNPTGYSGTVRAQVLNGSSFTYDLASDPGSITAPGTYTAGYFAGLRASFNLNAPAVGVVTASSDEATSTTLINPEQLKMLTLMDMRRLKTPFGREYLEWAQSYGTQLFGAS